MFNKGARTDTFPDYLNRLKEVAAGWFLINQMPLAIIEVTGAYRDLIGHFSDRP